MDTANYAIAGLAFGTFASQTINWHIVVEGLLFYLLFMLLGYILEEVRSIIMTLEPASVLFIGLMIAGLILAGPIIYHDWNQEKSKHKSK